MLMQIGKEVFELVRANPPFVGKRNSNFNFKFQLSIRAAAQVRVLQFSQSINTSNYSSIAQNKCVSFMQVWIASLCIFKSKFTISGRAWHSWRTRPSQTEPKMELYWTASSSVYFSFNVICSINKAQVMNKTEPASTSVLSRQNCCCLAHYVLLIIIMHLILKQCPRKGQ